MAMVQKEVQPAALLAYLSGASVDGRCPEVIACDSSDQAEQLQQELLRHAGMGSQQLLCAVQHEDQVTIWLTEHGVAVARAQKAGGPVICLPYAGE